MLTPNQHHYVSFFKCKFATNPQKLLTVLIKTISIERKVYLMHYSSMMKRSSLIYVIMVSVGNVGEGLVSKSLSAFMSRNTSMKTLKGSTKIKVFLDGSENSPILSSIASIYMQSNIFSATSQHIASDPQLEAELLSDVSYFALDFTTFVSSNTAWIRFCNVLGRILLILSDYIQDHYISPDEAFFQACMLAISMHMFLKSVWPVILAASSKTSLSVRDRRVFIKIFSELDVSALQFKCLLASRALEWIELKHDEQADLNGDYMYWLHSGNVSSSLQKQNTHPEDNTALQIRYRLFGEGHFAKALEESMFVQKKQMAKADKVKDSDDSNPVVHETLTAGPNGALMLRMSTSKVLMLMDHDDQLFNSINRLILLRMEEKLAHTLEKDKSRNPCVY